MKPICIQPPTFCEAISFLYFITFNVHIEFTYMHTQIQIQTHTHIENESMCKENYPESEYECIPCGDITHNPLLNPSMVCMEIIVRGWLWGGSKNTFTLYVLSVRHLTIIISVTLENYSIHVVCVRIYKNTFGT